MVPGRPDNETIKTVTSKFMLVHYLQNCALTTSGKQLPKWAYEQQEVSCNPNMRDKNALWNVEDNVFAKREYTYLDCRGRQGNEQLILANGNGISKTQFHSVCKFVH